jgi:hypothetical protein
MVLSGAGWRCTCSFQPNEVQPRSVGVIRKGCWHEVLRDVRVRPTPLQCVHIAATAQAATCYGSHAAAGSRVVRSTVTGPPNTTMGLRCTIPARMARQGNPCMGSPAQIVLLSVTCTGKSRQRCALKICSLVPITRRLTGTLTRSGIHQLAFRQIGTSIMTSRQTPASGSNL